MKKLIVIVLTVGMWGMAFIWIAITHPRQSISIGEAAESGHITERCYRAQGLERLVHEALKRAGVARFIPGAQSPDGIGECNDSTESQVAPGGR